MCFFSSIQNVLINTFYFFTEILGYFEILNPDPRPGPSKTWILKNMDKYGIKKYV